MTNVEARMPNEAMNDQNCRMEQPAFVIGICVIGHFLFSHLHQFLFNYRQLFDGVDAQGLNGLEHIEGHDLFARFLQNARYVSDVVFALCVVVLHVFERPEQLWQSNT